MPELKGREYLIRRLNQKASRVRLRYRYYEMKNKARDFGIATPPSMRLWNNCLGWCSKAVDSLADRLQFKGFKDDALDMTAIFSMNDPDTLYDSAILSALIGSCSFIYLAKDDDGYPRMRVIDGRHATGIMDQSTGLLYEGYAILLEDTDGKVLEEAYFAPGRTDFYIEGKKAFSVTGSTGHVLLVPVVNRPDDVRPFGHSRITRACMSIVDSAIRSVKRMEIADEFGSFPQRYLLGTDPDREPLDKWRAVSTAILEITASESGANPTAGQFAQVNMEPHQAQVKVCAGLFAGETGLTMDDLGFPTENPSSAEAIKASHENLRLMARKAQRNFGNGLRNAGYVAACLRDDYDYDRSAAYMTTPLWSPLFEPDAAMLSAIGDGILKLNQAVPGYVDADKMAELIGF